MLEARTFFINPEPSTLPLQKIYPGRGGARFLPVHRVFPNLAVQEDIKQALADQNQVLYTGNFLAETYLFNELLNLDPRDINLAELIFKQHQTRYSSVIEKINAHQLMEEHKKRYEKRYKDRENPFAITLKEYKTRYRFTIKDAAERTLETQELKPNFSLPETTGLPDPSINLVLALHLALGSRFKDTNISIQTIDELASFAKEHNQSFDPSALRDGLVSLVSENTVKDLLNRGLLKENSLESFYEKVAALMVDNSLYLAKQNLSTGAFLFPYPTGLFSEAALGNPDYAENTAIAVDFLPHLFGAYLNYLIKFHEAIKEGQSFDPMRLQGEIQRLFRFSGEALSDYMRQLLGISKHVPQPDLKELFAKTQQEEPILAENVAQIYTSLQQMKPYFEQILAYYKKHPELLNKLLPDADPEAHITSFKTWQGEILKHGGKPSSHIRIQFRHNVRRNQV